MKRTLVLLAVLVLALPPKFYGQTYVLAPTPVFTGFDTNGDPVASGRLCTYAAGTTTALASYSDSSGTANTNPVILNSAGRATVYLSNSSYRFILRDSTASSSTCTSPGGTTIWDQDNIVAPSAISISGTTNTIAKFNTAGTNITNSSITDNGSAITLGSATTITTSATVPRVIGGTLATAGLELRATSGVGTSGAITLTGGDNGAVTMLTANTGGVSSNLGLTVNSVTTTNGTFGSLTSGRVTFAGASGLLSDDADLTFSGDRLTATNLTVSSLTGGFVTATPAGALGVTTSVSAASGGTAINTSASSGIPSINSGTWAVNNVLTANRVLYGAASNTVASSSNFTFDGTTLSIASNFKAVAAGGVYVGSATDPGNNNFLAGSAVYFTSIGTTGSAANMFIDTGSTPVGNILRSTSSIRYKTDIAELSAMEARKILTFTPIRFLSTASADDPKREFWGLQAEDVDSKLPVILTHFLPADTVQDGPNYKKAQYLRTIDGVEMVPDGVQYDRLVVPLLVIAKEHDARIATLEAAVTALRAKLP